MARVARQFFSALCYPCPTLTRPGFLSSGCVHDLGHDAPVTHRDQGCCRAIAPRAPDDLGSSQKTFGTRAASSACTSQNSWLLRLAAPTLVWLAVEASCIIFQTRVADPLVQSGLSGSTNPYHGLERAGRSFMETHACRRTARA